MIASVRTLLSYIYRRLLDLEPFETRTAAQSSVRIRGLLAGRKVAAVVFDLDGTLAQLDWAWAERVVRQTAWLERLVPEAQRRLLVRRFMVLIEGLINVVIGQMQRWGMDRRLAADHALAQPAARLPDGRRAPARSRRQQAAALAGE